MKSRSQQSSDIVDCGGFSLSSMDETQVCDHSNESYCLMKAISFNVNICFCWEKKGLSSRIDLMHDDVTAPKCSMVVVVTLKSKMAASSAGSGGNSKSA